MTGRRVCRSYVQSIEAPVVQVFPLLCPVREREWARGWVCDVVYSRSGMAEAGCVFVTPNEEGADSVWCMTVCDPEGLRAEFVKVRPGHSVTEIKIGLEADGEQMTRGRVSYTVTGLSAAGNAFVDDYTEEHYQAFMGEWEGEMNHFLSTGRMLDD